MKEKHIKDPGSAITHFIGMLMAIFAAVPLLIKAAREPGHIYVISLAIYALSLILLYAASTTYHTFDISERVNTVLKKIDHMMISVLIAVTALIPLFGAFIGCVVGAFLILIVSPMKAVWFLVIFLILQQLEGNLVYPRVVGSSVGLPSIWVLAAVTIGASTLGVAGMFIAIPLFSVIYQVLRKDSARRVREKKIPPDKLA